VAAKLGLQLLRASEIPFDIITEDGTTRLTIPQYHTRPDLMAKVGLVTTPTDGRATVFCGTTIVSFPHDLLEKDKGRQKVFRELEDMVRKSPLKYFVPQNDAVMMLLNDTEHNMKGFVAPNGAGKSVTGCIDVLLDIVPCDPKWPIFTVHGIKHRKYKGPRILGGVGIVSYEWNNHITTIWPQIVKRWTPEEALGEWAEGRGGVINWKNNPRIEIAGTPVWFFACSQAQTVFEASAMDIYWWDEQGEEAKFNGANMRLRRRNGRHVMTLTPHRVEGRPDTGSGSWIHKMYTGEITAGLNPKFYSCPIDGIPDWIYSEQAKKDAKREWIDEPSETGNIKKLREGRSRILGEFHESSGLVFDEFDANLHVIDDFDIPEDWTKYRYVDHGRVEPTACLWVAVSPQGERFIYRDYYKKDRVVSENANAIIEMSGNRKRRIDDYTTSSGTHYTMYEEVFVKEKYRWTKLDSRSMAKKADNTEFTIGDIYRQCGIRVQPADGQPVTTQVPVAKEMFILDYERKHRRTDEPGAPTVYILASCKSTLWELQRYVNEQCVRRERSGSFSQSEKPKAKDDHLMSCLLFMAMDRPIYIGGLCRISPIDNEEEVIHNGTVYDRITGY